MRLLALALAASTTFFGTTVSDPYRWLEDASSARTQAWIDAQNARADRTIDRYPENARIAKRVGELALTGPQRFGPVLRAGKMFFMQEVPPQPQPVLVAQSWPNGSTHVVVDPARFGQGVSIDFYWPSPSGKLLALATAQGGAESATIRVAGSDGHVYADALGPAGGGTTPPGVLWDSDERGFTYTRLPAGSQFGVKLYHHVLGQPQSSDVLALKAVSPIAEFAFLSSDDARHAAALVNFGDGTYAHVYVRKGSTWTSAVGPDAGIDGGQFVGNRLLLVETAGTPRGRIVALKPDGTLATVVAQPNDWAYHNIYPIARGFLVLKSWGTVWRLDQFSNDGYYVRTVGLPDRGIGIDDVASSSAQPEALISYEGWAGPAGRWDTYDASTGALQTVFDVKPPSRAYANVRVTEISATSKDGTHVPVTVIALKSTKQDGNAPTMLTAYGGFDIPTTPYFIGSALTWLEMGGVLAVANIRGGNEFGETWHLQGRKLLKQNVFDDFYASAQALVDQKWTNPKRLGIQGGSNGGLLVGAALVQHPSEYGAVVGFAGIYDTLRNHLFPNGTYNEPEYGSVGNPEQFAALYAYSPYHHVTAGTAYPAVLLIDSENDPRVPSWQSWKFGAALQNATTSNKPVLVLTHRTGGHGHGESFAQAVGNEALLYSFLAQQLGVP